MSAEQFDWTPAVIDRFKELWHSGMKTHEIATRLGISTSAVSGARNRFGRGPRRAPNGLEWTEDKLSLLRQLWKDGMPIARIAAEFNVAPHVIFYRANELNLPRRRRADSSKAPQKSTVVGETQIPAPARADAPVPLQPAIWTELSWNWLTPAETRSCAWPIGEPGTPSFRFCDDPASAGKPYCAEHCRAAFVPQAERREHLRRIDRDASNGLAHAEVEQWV